MIDALRAFTPKFMKWDAPHPQVKSVLSKILLCRTAALKGHLYKCRDCHSPVNVYNSCVDRHCPQCGGARRGEWMAKNAEVVLPGVPYFQVVFTMPDKLSSLILGNRKELYDVLFRSAWRALDSQVRHTSKFRPAALMVLHTWNQQLEHHPHIHALVPGAGPSIDADRWTVARHPKHRRRRKPYLTDNASLGQAFRDHYIRTLRRLLVGGKLKLGGSVAFLKDPVERKRWLGELAAVDWNVFIQGPPHGKSDPQQVVKYLASYLTGGPLRDGRLIRIDPDQVHFWARPKNSRSKSRRGMSKPEPFRLSGRSFMQRWALHILPKGYVRSRCYGGYHGASRLSYLSRCRRLLDLPPATLPEQEPPSTEDDRATSPRRCSNCDGELVLVSAHRRPSWTDVFTREVYRHNIYIPQHHIGTGRSPPTLCAKA